MAPIHPFIMRRSILNSRPTWRAAILIVVVVICVAIGRVAQHAYVAAVTAGFTLVLGLVWPWLILRLISASSQVSFVRCRVREHLELKVDVTSRWPLVLPEIELTGGPESHVLIDVSPMMIRRGRQTISVGMAAQRRGVFNLYDLTIGTSFPFGLRHARCAIAGNGRLIVWPIAEPIDVVVLRGATRTLAADLASSRIAAEGELAGVRGYRRGDAMRSIHWQQTARHDRLIVRERAGGERRCCTVCLDTRRASYETEALFERAVSIATGIIEQGLREGLAVELRTEHSRYSVHSERDLPDVLDVLAAISWTDVMDVPAGFRGIRALLVTTVAGSVSAATGGLRPCLVNGGSP